MAFVPLRPPDRQHARGGRDRHPRPVHAPSEDRPLAPDGRPLRARRRRTSRPRRDGRRSRRAGSTVSPSCRARSTSTSTRCSARRDVPTATSTSAGWRSHPRAPPPGRATSHPTSAGSRSTPRRPTPTRARSGSSGWLGRAPSTGRPSPDVSVRATARSSPFEREDDGWVQRATVERAGRGTGSARGYALSAVGQSMAAVPVLVLVHQRTSSLGWMGVVAAARLVPYLIVSPVAGVLADRVDRRGLLRAALRPPRGDAGPGRAAHTTRHPWARFPHLRTRAGRGSPAAACRHALRDGAGRSLRSPA